MLIVVEFLERIREMKAPIIFGDGKQIRDFIYVGDIVEFNLLAMKKNNSKYSTFLKLGIF